MLDNVRVTTNWTKSTSNDTLGKDSNSTTS